MRKLTEISDDDQRVILDLEMQILRLKQDMIGASSSEKESYKDQIESIKQQIQSIKDSA